MAGGVEEMPNEERFDLQDERISKQDERLNKQDERLNQHSEKISRLMKHEEENHKRISAVEKNYEKLETTIVSENKEMRLFFQSNMDKQWDLIKSRDAQKHESQVMKHDLDKTKIERWSDIALKVAGAGGIIYLLIQQLL